MTDELLIRFLLKETSEEESIAVQNWIDAAPSNKDNFLKFEKIWTSSKNLAKQSAINEDEAWLKFKQKTADGNQPVVKKLNPIKSWLKIAALLFMIAAGWSVYSILSPVSYTNVSAGNRVTIKTLPDGSELTLNKHSSVSYASNFNNNRSIHLEKGDVFFDVAHDKNRPFIIDVDQVSILVVGTSFNVKHLNDETEVVVETGIVKVSLGAEEISLQKGEKVMISKGSTKLIKAQNTDQLYNYYRTKEFVANNTPLRKLIEVLNEEYGSNIIIQDQSVKNLTITTTLKADASLEANLQVICVTADLKLIRNQNQIILSNHQ